MKELRFSIPFVPPTVNHYVKHTRRGIHYVTSEALAFKSAVSLLARRRTVDARRYELEVSIYLGKGDRGDGDNFWKVIADGLVEAGCIHSDAAVDDWILHKRRDTEFPRTEIIIRGKDDI